MKKDILNQKIKETLQEQAAQYTISPLADSRIHKMLQDLSEKEMRSNMKKFSVKKAVIGAVAAVMVLGSVTAIASGKLRSISTSGYKVADYTDFADLGKAETKTGVVSNACKQFSNGYTFDGIYLLETDYLYENGAQTDSFTTLSIEYHKGADIVTYDIMPRPLNEDIIQNTETLNQDGITYYYHYVKNKFVPVNYEPTEEETAQMQAGTLNIAYGADNIRYADSKQIWWETEGHQYSLFCMDNDISKEELLHMAYELN